MIWKIGKTLLVRLRRETGVGLVFVSHDLAVVSQACDVVAVMYAGQLVEIGSVDRVLHEPAHPYTSGLLRSVPTFGKGRTSLRSCA